MLANSRPIGRPALALIALFAAVLAPSIASADQIKYVGLHPVAKTAGGGFCYIEAPHVHIYAPVKAEARVLYRDHDGYRFFVGDPAAYGYEGDKSTYNGHHPIQVDAYLGVNAEVDDDVEFCYIDGPHYHVWAPPAEAQFEVKGGVYWFVGTFPPRYKKQKRLYSRINVVVAPIAYEPPVITIEPPSAWVGIGVGVHGGAGVGVGGGVSGGVGISGGVAIEVPPPPTVEIGVGVSGGVSVGGGGHAHVRGKHKGAKRRGSHGHRSKRKSTRRRKKSSKFRW